MTSRFDFYSSAPAEPPKVVVLQFLHDLVELVDFFSLLRLEPDAGFLPPVGVRVLRRQLQTLRLGLTRGKRGRVGVDGMGG